MTTLPTTTAAVRVPRAAAPSVLSIPQPGALAPAGAAGQQGGMTANDILRVLRANIWLIIAFLILGGIAGVAAYWVLNKYYPRFTAVGFVRVDPPRMIDPTGSAQQEETIEVGQIGVLAKTQAQLLSNPVLFKTVLGQVNLEIQQTKWINQFKRANGTLDDGKAREDLEDHFGVAPVADSQLIRVSFTCNDPRDARIVVQDIVNQHLIDQDRSRRDRTASRTEQLNNMKRRLEFAINQRQVEIRELNKRLADSGMAVTNRMSPREAELYELTRSLIELKTDHEQAKQQYEQVVGQLNQGIDPPTVEAYVNQDQQIFSLRSMLAAVEIELKSMPSQGNLNRRLDDLEARRAATEQQLADRLAEVKITARAAIRSSAEQMFAYTQAQLEGVNDRMASLRSELGDLNFTIFEAMSKQDDLTADKERLKQVQNNLDMLSIATTREQTGVNWASPVDEPDMPSFPKLSVVLPVALMASLGLALAIAFIREALDTTIRSPRDIQKVGQLSLLGMIPHEDDDPQVSGVPLPMVIFQAPTSILAEQFRQVRTRLQHAASLDTTRSILITSPGPGDGKTTVACNLAAGLALNGRRILLVDVNFRRPALHKTFALANEAGLSTVMADLGNFENAVKQTQVPNLDVLPCGPKPENTTELLESQRFTEFVERALEQYDHVLFDSGPLLLVSDTVALAPRVDGVISVVKAATNTRGLLSRLRDNLRQIKAEHLGVVLNGVRAQGGGYYGRSIKDYYAYQNGHAK